MTTLMLEEEIEAWQDDKNLTLINQPYDTPTFYSRCWHPTSTPDIALCTEDLHSITMREVGNQLGGSDHRPAYLTLEARTVQASTLPRWNYKKANWSLYRHRTSILTNSIQVYDRDINIVIKSLTILFFRQQRNVSQKVREKTTNHTGMKT